MDELQEQAQVTEEYSDAELAELAQLELEESENNEADPADDDTKEEPKEEVKPDEKPKSVREAAEQAYKQLESSKEDPGDKSPEKEEPKTKAQDKDEPKPVVDIKPPQRLTAQQKQVFNKLPSDLKKPYAAMVKQQEAKFTQRMQEASNKEKEASHVIEAVRPYLLAHPELAEQGYTESKLVSSLLAAHQRLTDPKTAKAELARIGKQIGVDVSAVVADEGASTPDPQIEALQEKIRQLESYVGNNQQAAINQRAGQIQQEMAQVVNQVDAVGNYLYPELHESAFMKRVEPLVRTLVESMPEIGYGEALKRAYLSLTGKSPTTQTQQTRLPDVQNRIKKAAVSVRGKSSPSVTGHISTEDIPDEALKNTLSAAEWAYKQLKMGA